MSRAREGKREMVGSKSQGENFTIPSTGMIRRAGVSYRLNLL